MQAFYEEQYAKLLNNNIINYFKYHTYTSASRLFFVFFLCLEEVSLVDPIFYAARGRWEEQILWLDVLGSN